MIIETPSIHTILDAVASPILICQNNNILFANQAAEKLTGYSMQKMLMMGISNLIHASSSVIFHTWYSSQPDESANASLDIRLETAKPSLIWVSIIAAPTDYNGRTALMLTLHNTTTFRSAENRLLMGENGNDLLLENHPDVMTITNYQGQFVYVTSSVTQAFGYLIDDVIGRRWQEWIYPEDISTILDAIEEVREDAKNVKKEIRIRQSNGDYVWCEAILGMIYHQHGHQITLMSIIRNIHQYKLNEFALKEREQRLRMITDNMLDIVLEIGEDGLIRYISPSCLPIMGYKPEELIGQSHIESVHPDDVPSVLAYFTDALKNPAQSPLEMRFRHRNGSYLWIEIVYNLVKDEQGNLQSIVISCREVTSLRKNRQTLHEQERLLSQITDIAPFGIYIYDVNQKRDVYHNQRLLQEAALEYYSENPPGEFYNDYVHPDDQAQHQAHQKRLMEAKDGEVIESENRVRRGDGSYSWFYFRDSVFKRDANGVPYQFVGSMQDISERKASEEILSQNQHLLQKITDTVPLDIYIYDVKQKRNIYFNRTQNMGYPLDVLDSQQSGDFYASLVHPDDKALHAENGIRLQNAKDGELIESEYRMKHADGEWRWYYFRDIVFARAADGSPSQFLGTIQDITARKSTEAALRESQQVLHQVTTAVPMDIYIFDVDTQKTIFANRPTNLGIDPQPSMEPGGQYFGNRVHPDDRARYDDFHQRLAASPDGAYVEGEFRMLRVNGTYMWRSYRNMVLQRHTNGTPSQYLGTVEDVSARKEIEAALSESQHLFQRLTQAAPIQIFIYDYDLQRNIYENRPSDLGFAPAIMTNASADFFTNLIHPDDRAKHDEIIRKLQTAADGEMLEYEFRMLGADGRYMWRYYRWTPFARRHDGSLSQFLGTVLNVDERKRISDALIENEEKLRLITDNLHDLVSLADSDLKFRYLTPSHIRVLGYKPEEMLGKSAFELVHPEDLDLVKSKTLLAMDKLQSDTIEFRYRHHDGYYIWMETTGSIILDPQGQFGGAVFASRDISERRWMQRAMLEQEKLLVMLQKEQELSSLKTRMMSRLSHELRTPLAVIATSADLLEMYWQRMNETQRNDRLQQIKAQIKHFTSMLDNMSLVVKGISYNLEFAPSPYDISQTCETLIAELQELLHSQHTIHLELKGDVNVVNSDEQLIYLILTHLLANAIKYTPQSKPITITGEVKDDAIVLQVRDEGIGIPADEHDRILEPFYRATNIGEVPGLGIGLTIVKDAIDSMNGTMTIASQLDVGTTVTVEVPMGGTIGLN
ncbi:MAG: PAS domain S-box protein [Chloroflexi bacterium]|nr:PAS domain S-box protein [Chloroflexota bacterium]MCC6892586.1 PAS domain S-box protein [Anaerolineae bacterium]